MECVAQVHACVSPQAPAAGWLAQVLEPAWARFMKKLSGAKDLDAVIALHDGMLETIMKVGGASFCDRQSRSRGRATQLCCWWEKVGSRAPYTAARTVSMQTGHWQRSGVACLLLAVHEPSELHADVVLSCPCSCRACSWTACH